MKLVDVSFRGLRTFGDGSLASGYDVNVVIANVVVENLVMVKLRGPADSCGVIATRRPRVIVGSGSGNVVTRRSVSDAGGGVHAL